MERALIWRRRGWPGNLCSQPVTTRGWKLIPPASLLSRIEQSCLIRFLVYVKACISQLKMSVSLLWMASTISLILLGYANGSRGSLSGNGANVCSRSQRYVKLDSNLLSFIIRKLSLCFSLSQSFLLPNKLGNFKSINHFIVIIWGDVNIVKILRLIESSQ